MEYHISQLEKKVETLENAILKHHEYYANLDNYQNYSQGDVDLWENVKDKIKEGDR